LRTTLEGGVAVITGAASGIGRALAQRLASEKSSLALADVDGKGLEETARLAAAAGTQVSTHLVDVGDAVCMERFAGEVLSRHQRVTLLVNNAGVALLGSFEEISLEEMEWLMKVNFWGVVHGVKYFLPVLRREPRAHIVNVSSIFGIIAPAGDSAYCASKFAIRGFTECLQQELAGSSVGVSCALPGRVQTSLSQKARIPAGASLQRVNRTEPQAAPERSITSAEGAADGIIEGVKRGKGRILIGADAAWADRLQRAFPSSYQKVLWSLSKLRKWRPAA
jgi:short-subunit dehydrogenase